MIPQCQIIHLALHRKGHLWNPIAPHSSRRGHIGIDRSGLSHLLAQSRIKLEIVSHRIGGHSVAVRTVRAAVCIQANALLRDSSRIIHTGRRPDVHGMTSPAIDKCLLPAHHKGHAPSSQP